LNPNHQLNDLKTKFERVEVVATLQCAGNRQQDFVHAGRPLFVAPHWNNTAIGCAKWAGVRVRDVLGECGLDVDAMSLGKLHHSHVKMVNFIGEDADETGVPYAGVLPIHKVIDPFGDAILAYEMNGETLPRDHGYPIRLLAPGHAGCRNVKWVKSIHLSAAASKLDSGSKLDRHFAPNVTFIDHLRHGDDHVRLDQGPVIQTFPVQSVLCEVRGRVAAGGEVGVTLTNSPFSFGQNGEVSANIVGDINGIVDSVEVKGVAWSGGGRGICRVEVAIDGGQDFVAAELTTTQTHQKNEDQFGAPESGQGKHWAWVHYAQQVPLTDAMKKKLQHGEKVQLEVVVKAVDGDLNSQPEKMEHAWNVLGICPNHWPRAHVTIVP
jgi:sulfite oxidase